MPTSLYQCQCQRTVPAANQMSPKSVLLDDYHGETSHHWPKVLLPQAIALLPRGPSPALTTSSASQIHFLSMVCFVPFGRVLFFSPVLTLFCKRQRRTSLSVYLQRQNSGFSFPSRLVSLETVAETQKVNNLFIFSSFCKPTSELRDTWMCCTDLMS